MTGELAELARLYLTGSNTDSSFTINLWPAAVAGALLFGCEYMISCLEFEHFTTTVAVLGYVVFSLGLLNTLLGPAATNRVQLAQPSPALQEAQLRVDQLDIYPKLLQLQAELRKLQAAELLLSQELSSR